MSFDRREDIHGQNVAKARAMARMDIYDALPRIYRDVYKTRALPVDPTPDDICACVESHGGYFAKSGRLVVPVG